MSRYFPKFCLFNSIVVNYNFQAKPMIQSLLHTRRLILMQTYQMISRLLPQQLKKSPYSILPILDLDSIGTISLTKLDQILFSCWISILKNQPQVKSHPHNIIGRKFQKLPNKKNCHSTWLFNLRCYEIMIFSDV